MHDAVDDGLRQKWSPEQISKRLKEDHPDDPEMRVSHETIYECMYSLSGAGSSPRVSFRLSAETRQAAEKIAEQEGVSLSELARHALEELVHKRAS